MQVNLVVELLGNGIIAGSYYALLGVSWTVIYGPTRVFHFAHGLIYVVAAYTAVLFTMNLGLPLFVGSILAVVMAVLLGCGIELAIYRPLRKRGATQFVTFIASLGMLILGQNVIQMLFGPAFRSLKGFPIIPIFLGPLSFTTVHLLMMAVSMLAILAIHLYLTRSKFGKAIQAVACNPEMAEAVGIDKGRAYLLSFALGSGAMALGAVLFTLDRVAAPAMGITPLFMAFTVTFIGGAGSVLGAVAGGFLLGVIENLCLLYVSGSWKVIVAFAVLVFVITLRPSGLFSRGR